MFGLFERNKMPYHITGPKHSLSVLGRFALSGGEACPSQKMNPVTGARYWTRDTVILGA
jgi:hypothetical protein